MPSTTSSIDSAPVPPPPRRPPPAQLAPPSIATMQHAGASSHSFLRAKALNKVSRWALRLARASPSSSSRGPTGDERMRAGLVSLPHEMPGGETLLSPSCPGPESDAVFVMQVERLVASAGPQLDRAAHKAKKTAHLHLANIRDRHDGWETPPGVITTPKGGPSRSGSRTPAIGEFSDPAAAGAPPSQAQASAAGGSRWGGLTSYFSAGAREERDKSFYTEERIVCFPGVSGARWWRKSDRRSEWLTDRLGTLAARDIAAIDALGFRTSAHPRRLCP